MGYDASAIAVIGLRFEPGYLESRLYKQKKYVCV